MNSSFCILFPDSFCNTPLATVIFNTSAPGGIFKPGLAPWTGPVAERRPACASQRLLLRFCGGTLGGQCGRSALLEEQFAVVVKHADDQSVELTAG